MTYDVKSVVIAALTDASESPTPLGIGDIADFIVSAISAAEEASATMKLAKVAAISRRMLSEFEETKSVKKGDLMEIARHFEE